MVLRSSIIVPISDVYKRQGKASVTSPTGFTVKDGKVTASVEWSSPYYDYMLIGCLLYTSPVHEATSTQLCDVPEPSSLI